MKENIIYVIYDREYHEILAKFTNEEECVYEYTRHFNYNNCNWIAINLKNIVRSAEENLF